MLKKPVLKFETFLLRRAHSISTISNNMMEVGRRKTGKNIFYFPNWISESNINSKLFKQHEFIDSSKFTMLYSGNIGEKQDWSCLIELAHKIKPTDNIEIVIVGNGAYLGTLKQQIKLFSFIKIFEPVPYAHLNDLLCSANLHFLFQKTNVLDTVMPSKLLAMMASEKPSVVTGNASSEVRTIFEKSDCGIYLSNNNIEELYNNILKIKQDESLQLQMGRCAKKYVLQHFSQEKVLNNYYDEVIKAAI
jgi:colanic acid biosynthesis glycosyl transferase WcaI